MIDEKFWQKINSQQTDYDQSRRVIIGEANQALHLSKQAIFALHRDNIEDAKVKIGRAKEILTGLEQNFHNETKLRFEGAWSAAVEEFVEANLFLFYLEGQIIGAIKDLNIFANEYLGGLSDYTGELVRRAVLQASKRAEDEVKTIAEEIESVIEHLLNYDLTGPLRTKFDQAKKNLQKIEHIVYDLSLKD